MKKLLPELSYANSMPVIILVNPQMVENIGAAARVMANFGYRDLRLVAPRDGWPNDKALVMGAGAYDHLGDVRIFGTLKGALSDIHFALGTTARQRDMVKPVYGPQEAGDEIKARGGATDHKTALVFGPERTGLTNEDLCLLNGFITVPTNPDFPSLNLAQSIALMVYECVRESQTSRPQLDYGDSQPVGGEEFENFMSRLITELDEANFFKAEGLKESMTRSLYNIFTRTDLSDQEVRTLHGVISALIGNKQ